MASRTMTIGDCSVHEVRRADSEMAILLVLRKLLKEPTIESGTDRARTGPHTSSSRTLKWNGGLMRNSRRTAGAGSAKDVFGRGTSQSLTRH